MFFKAKIDALTDLLESGATEVTDPNSALIVANIIKSIVNDGGEGSNSTIGMEVSTKAVNATEVRS